MAKPKNKFNVGEESMESARELGNKKKFHVHDLVSFQPKTLRQEEFADYFTQDYEIIIQRGAAGTGKTAMAMYYALLDVLDPSNHFEKVLYIKPCVEERKRGFVPGELDDKDAQFEVSIIEVTNGLLKYNDSYKHLKSLGYLEFATTGHRGRTFYDTVIVCDEAQNYDYRELKTVMERVAEGSRVIICGDETQEDLSRHREKSGFEKFIKVCEAIKHTEGAGDVKVGIVNYTPEDNVRKGVSKAFSMADYYFVEV